jgi:short-subunit dehydrogenase
MSETERSVKVQTADLGKKAARAKIEAILRDDLSITMLVNIAGIASVAAGRRRKDGGGARPHNGRLG